MQFQLMEYPNSLIVNAGRRRLQTVRNEQLKIIWRFAHRMATVFLLARPLLRHRLGGVSVRIGREAEHPE